MSEQFLDEYQMDAVDRMFNGCILNGSVGSGKSRVGIYYYFKEHGGSFVDHEYVPMQNPRDLYIITTARKRDTLDFVGELAPFRISPYPDAMIYKGMKVTIDSWNNIKKYSNVYGAFFIFDEDRVTGSGAWVKAFYKIAKKNRWIILSATSGDKWEDYIPVFVANGFYKHKSAFLDEHAVRTNYGGYPQIDIKLGTKKLERLRDSILVDMEVSRHTVRHHEEVLVRYNIPKYKDAIRYRWDPFKNEPIQQASGLCYVLRRIVNSDESRQVALLEIFENHPRIIVFYSFDYELDILRNMYFGEGVKVAEWNGKKHESIPTGDSWVYLCQYTSACEGFNCITTDTMVFFSQNYSYKVMEQAAGRIDRRNTPYTDLYYYHLRTRSGIDLAITKALMNKKKFNERKYVKW